MTTLDTYPVSPAGNPMPLDSMEAIRWLDDADDEAQDWYFDLMLQNRNLARTRRLRVLLDE